MVTILFDCKECGLLRAKAFCRDRKKQGEGITRWVEDVARVAVKEYHSILSPLCRSHKVDLYIPADGPMKGVGPFLVTE